MSNGLLIGLMYSLIALGFVLVYKATDAINFAQGEFVMIAGFVAAGGLMVWGVNLWLSIALAIASLVVFGFVLERVMLRKLIGRPVIAVVMATIGLASTLRGVGPFTGFSGGDPRRPRLHSRADPRRLDRRRRREHRRRLHRSLRRRRHEGLRAVRPHDPGANGSSIRHVRQTHH